MRFTIHTGLKVCPFELHHSRKPRIEVTNIVEDKLFIRMDNIKRFSTTETDPDLCGPKRKRRTDRSHNHGREKSPAARHTSHRRTVKPVRGNFQYPYTFFEKRNQKKSLEGKYKKKLIIAIDGTEHTIRAADKKITPKNNNTD